MKNRKNNLSEERHETEKVFPADRKILFVGFYAVLILFTLYVVLDTFVIRHADGKMTVRTNAAIFDNETPDMRKDPDPESDETSDGNIRNSDSEDDGRYDYADENIRIRIFRERKLETEIYCAEILLTSAEYLKTAFAENTYGRNIVQNTSVMAADHHAILAVNGDFYGSRERGYVIRNGVDYPRTTDIYDVLCIFTDGNMVAYGPEEYASEALVEMGVWQAFSFGPTLVKDGETAVGEKDEVRAAYQSNPRCAIGMIEPDHFLFVVSDGRTTESAGLSLYELAGYMKEKGAEFAYNLDGGGSATMVFDGKVINKPTHMGTKIEERPISDIVYIGYE